MKVDRTRHKYFPFKMQNAALLVIDFQRYFTDPKSHAFIPLSPKILPSIKKLIAEFRRSKRPVFFTRHIDVDPNNLMSRWWNDRIEETDPMSALNDELPVDYGKIIIKHQYDAFLNTGLEDILKKNGVKQVVITGVVTHLCCETTARSAFMKNFETFFAIDATASYDPQHHEAAIFNLSHGFAIPVKTNELT